MATMQQVGTHMTTVSRNPLRVTYHSTVVVEQLPDGRIKLDSGGWRTPTTKTRMNQASNQYGLGFAVASIKKEWRIARAPEYFAGKTIKFEDGIILEKE